MRHCTTTEGGNEQQSVQRAGETPFMGARGQRQCALQPCLHLVSIQWRDDGHQGKRFVHKGGTEVISGVCSARKQHTMESCTTTHPSNPMNPSLRHSMNERPECPFLPQCRFPGSTHPSSPPQPPPPPPPLSRQWHAAQTRGRYTRCEGHNHQLSPPGCEPAW